MPGPADRATVETPREVRELVAFTEGAGREQLAVLRYLALSAENPLVAGNALRALGRLRAVARDPELVSLLSDPRLRVRQEVVRALGIAAEREQLEELVAILEHADERLRPMVIEALGRIGGELAQRTLEAVLRDPGSTEVDRTFARRALTDARPSSQGTRVQEDR